MTSIAPCPVCGRDLYFENGIDIANKYRRYWLCEICRASGDVVDLVRHITGCSISRAIAGLSGDTPMPDHRSKAARQHALARTRKIEDVARRYGLTLMQTTERPEAPAWLCGTGWLRGGKTFITICPICEGRLFVYIDVGRQMWTCRQCSRGYVTRPDQEYGDAIDLVQHFSGCGFNQAVWYLAGGGPKPGRKIEK